jgi:bis(5'-nucleosidyl)-tetraphosphatase
MTIERSAGVIVFRQSPGGREYLLLDYGKYSKGHVERRETDVQAAIRELREETGIADVTLTEGFAEEIRYFFRPHGRGLVQKSVIFFLGQTQAAALRLSHEHVGGGFFSFEAAVAKVKFASSKAILRKAEEFLHAPTRV